MEIDIVERVLSLFKFNRFSIYQKTQIMCSAYDLRNRSIPVKPFCPPQRSLYEETNLTVLPDVSDPQSP